MSTAFKKKSSTKKISKKGKLRPFKLRPRRSTKAKSRAFKHIVKTGRWTPEEVERLRKLLTWPGMTIVRIARLMHRSVDSVWIQVLRLQEAHAKSAGTTPKKKKAPGWLLPGQGLSPEQIPDGSVTVKVGSVAFENLAMGKSDKAKPREGRFFRVYYGTDREPVDPAKPETGFTGDRGHRVYYGSCDVHIPKTHKIGSTGTSPWIFWRRDGKLDLTAMVSLAEDAFWQAVVDDLKGRELDKRSALVFIHGFNVSFDEAAIRAAQMGADLKIPGVTAFYSWPSKGSVADYMADESAIEASEPFITKFLIDFAEKSGAEHIHIIAHSMGNRGLLRALKTIAEKASAETSLPFTQLILAAPDVDCDTFRQLAAAHRKVAARATLYVSSKDKAVAASAFLHDYDRAGFVPPVTIVGGIDTIEVSNVDLTLLGHGYVASARDVLRDMHDLIFNNASPENRFGLMDALAGTLKYWIIGK